MPPPYWCKWILENHAIHLNCLVKVSNDSVMAMQHCHCQADYAVREIKGAVAALPRTFFLRRRTLTEVLRRPASKTTATVLVIYAMGRIACALMLIVEATDP